MLDGLWNRLEFLGDLRRHRIARWVFLLWAIVSTYDTFGSQFLPDDWAQKRRTVYQLIVMTTGWLSWETWLLIGAAILTVFALEYVARHKRKLALSGTSGTTHKKARLQMSIPAIGMIVCGTAFIGFLIVWLVQSGFVPFQIKASVKAPPSHISLPYVEVGSDVWAHEETFTILATAEEAYSETRTTFLAHLAEKNNATDDQILFWYCYAIINSVEVWGKRSPSVRFEPLNLKDSVLVSKTSGYTRSIEAPIPGSSASYSDLRVKRDLLKTIIDKIRATDSKPSWAPDIAVTAPPPPTPEPKVSIPKKENEKALIGSATLLFNADDDTLSVLKYEGIKSVAVEPITNLTVIPQSYVVTFVFYPYQGPFDVRIDSNAAIIGSLPALFYNVTQNEDRFVSVSVTRGALAWPRTHQTGFRFYRKD